MRVRDEQQEFGNPGRGVMLVSLPLSLQTKCQHPPEPFLFQAGTVASTLPRLPPFFFFLACDSNSLNSLSFGVFRYSLLLPSNERNDYFLKPPKDAAPSLQRLLTSKAHLSWGPSSLPPGCPGTQSNRIRPQLSLLPQIKRRASEALPELLRPVTPITGFEGRQSQDHSGIFGLVTNLEELEVDDWDF